MEDLALKYASYVSLTSFVFVLSTMLILETWIPKRPFRVKRTKRWMNNLGLIFLNTFIARFLLKTSIIAFAFYCQSEGFGLFAHFQAPYWLKVLLGFIIFDFFIYFQHVVFHAVPLLWRLHQVHHADLDLDATSGARFHTIEILLSLIIKYVGIFLIGPPVLAILIFEVVLNVAAMFNHSNIEIPHRIDKWLRLVIVTPDMHRIHHSHHIHETNSNFGFNLPWWDRIFGTYIEAPKDGHKNMKIGLEYILDEKDAMPLSKMLTMPFTKFSNTYTMNREDPK